MSEQLNICPFCAGEARHFEIKGTYTGWAVPKTVSCKDCGATAPTPGIWNKRTQKADAHMSLTTHSINWDF
ncbi:MAG: Lar family restriction alleviation protein [Candidatus Hydrogenedentes bacterium]|nr:Lar family restriction alleviation protein [Candidatus Hydrogenedentota bacterium]